MFTIIKSEIEKSTNAFTLETVVNIIYGNNEDYVKKWIEVYFDDIIRKKENEEYFVQIENGIYYLTRKHKIVLKGYIFSTYKQITEKVFSMRYLNFSGTKEDDLLKTLSNNIKLNKLDGLYPEITNNINHKVLSDINRQSLYEIYCAFEGIIRTKNNWSTIELIILQNKITRSFKKDLYNTIVKKSKNILNKPSDVLSVLVINDEIKNYEIVD